MAKLHQQLQEWVAANLLSSHQAAEILQYENTKPQRHWVLYGILSVGVTVLAIGIISMIAANWSEIPKQIKLLADFAVLGGLAWGLLHFHERGQFTLFEVGLVLYAALVLASIGLVAQIYHTGGDLYQALGYWLILLLPLTLSAQRSPLPHVWLLVLMAAVVSLVEAHGSRWFGSHSDEIWLAMLFASPAVLLLLSYFATRLLTAHAFPKVFKFWAVVLGCAAAVVADICIAYEPSIDYNRATMAGLLILFALAIIVVALDIQQGRLQRFALLGVLMLYLAGVLLATLDFRSSLVAAAVSILLAGLAAFYCALSGSRRLFNLFSVAIVLRFLIVYFEALGGLAYTGVGLILSGVLIMGVGFSWYKHRDRLHAFVAGVTQ
jgi:uncharacterized membrane protein